MTYKVCLIRIFSTRWAESLAFYRDVVGFPVLVADEEPGWAQFDLGDAGIGLERCDPTDPETRSLVGRFVGVSIEVDDIQATYANLRSKGVKFDGPPAVQPWGGVLAHFRDPDGNGITLLGRERLDTPPSR